MCTGLPLPPPPLKNTHTHTPPGHIVCLFCFLFCGPFLVQLFLHHKSNNSGLTGQGHSATGTTPSICRRDNCEPVFIVPRWCDERGKCRKLASSFGVRQLHCKAITPHFHADNHAKKTTKSVRFCCVLFSFFFF